MNRSAYTQNHSHLDRTRPVRLASAALAKMGTTLDRMTGGQWGLNVVTGFHAHEMAMFGLESVPRDQRYFMAAEFTVMLSIM